jgi:hypothetical protein
MVSAALTRKRAGSWAVLVCERVEALFGALADPVADDVEAGVAVEAEEGLEVLA